MFDSYNPAVLNEALQKGAGGSGGGTTVVANPEGEATAELSKLQVGESIFEIPVYTPFDFSTEEVDTGRKWIDGKEIYCKVVELSKSDFTATNDYHYTYALKTALGAETLLTVAGNYTIGSYGTSIIGLPVYVANNTDIHIECATYYASILLHSYPSGQSSAIKLSDQDTITAKIICYYTKPATEAKKSSKKK